MKKSFYFNVFIIIFILITGKICCAEKLEFEFRQTGFSKVYDVAYNGKTYVAVGSGGMITSSDDLVTWNFFDGFGTNINFRYVIFDDEKFYVADISGDKVFSSVDGYKWSIANEIPNKELFYDKTKKGGIRFVNSDTAYIVLTNGDEYIFENDRFIPEEVTVIDTVADGRKAYLSTINGKTYVVGKVLDGETDLPVYEYDEAYKFFCKKFGYIFSYIKNENLYVAASCPKDEVNLEINKKFIGINYKKENSIYFFDENLNEIAKHEFDGTVCAIDLKNGQYIAEVAVSQAEGMNPFYCNVKHYVSGNMTDWVELNVNENILHTIYEIPRNFGIDFGMFKYVHDVSNQSSKIYSNNCVYGIDAEMPFLNIRNNDVTKAMIPWEDNEFFYVSTECVTAKTPKAPFYAELERLRQAPIIQIDDKILSFETAPIIENGRTLVPMRFLFETMGADVEWDNETQTASVLKNESVVAFSIDSADAEVNGAVMAMDVPAQLIDGKTFVPIRFLSENLGYDVEWDEENNKIIIHTEE